MKLGHRNNLDEILRQNLDSHLTHLGRSPSFGRMPNFTTSQVAKMTGYPRRRVARMVERGELRYVQKLPGMTGSYLFRLSDIRRAFPNVVITEPPADTERVSA
jgi:excisionase family DNA binding protein